jgi:hypothetical protein
MLQPVAPALLLPVRSPLQTKLMDVSLMSPAELQWVDDYHTRVSAC